MSKKCSLISFVKDDRISDSPAHSRIAGVVAELLPQDESFEHFANAKDMLKGLSAAFSHSKVVVVCTETPRYLYLKKLLFQALNLEVEISDSILKAVAEHAPKENDETLASHTLVPKKSTVFLSQDGLFSGFAVKSGKQHLVVLPLDPNITQSVIENGFTEYLKTVIPPDEIPVDEAAKKNPVTDVLAEIIAEDICFAVAANKSSSFIKRRLSATDAWEESFKFADCDEENKGLMQKDFIAGLARQAQEKTGCSAGMAISNVFISEKEDDRMYVYVTVTSSMRARVAKVYAEPGEDARQLVEAAIETLLAMAGDYVDAGGFIGFPVNQDNVDIPEEEKRDRSRLALKLIISGLIAAIICVLIVVFGGRLVNAVKEYAGKNSDTNTTQIMESRALPTTNESSSESKPIEIEENLYDPKYLLSLLAEASSYAASEENSTTQTDATTEKTTTVTTKTTTAVTRAKQTTTTTTKAATTATPTTPVPTNPAQSAAGTFTFNVKGYGHGVGMSQEGAKEYARRGWTYEKILLHYYTPGVTLVDDPNKPESVTYGGNSIELIEYLARTVAQEIGTGSPIEALKAQAVAAYTFAKSYSFNVSRGQHAYSTSFNMDPNSNVIKAVNEVAGEYLSYRGKSINAFYFACAAGQTVSSASVWGGTVPYLKGGITSPETISTSSRSYTADEFKSLVESYNLTCGASKVIVLQDNPAEWIKIVRTGNAGYIETIRVGDKEIRGYSFRHDLLKLGIRSHCFTCTYTAT